MMAEHSADKINEVSSLLLRVEKGAAFLVTRQPPLSQAQLRVPLMHLQAIDTLFKLSKLNIEHDAVFAAYVMTIREEAKVVLAMFAQLGLAMEALH